MTIIDILSQNAEKYAKFWEWTKSDIDNIRWTDDGEYFDMYPDGAETLPLEDRIAALDYLGKIQAGLIDNPNLTAEEITASLTDKYIDINFYRLLIVKAKVICYNYLGL